MKSDDAAADLPEDERRLKREMAEKDRQAQKKEAHRCRTEMTALSSISTSKAPSIAAPPVFGPPIQIPTKKDSTTERLTNIFGEFKLSVPRLVRSQSVFGIDPGAQTSDKNRPTDSPGIPFRHPLGFDVDAEDRKRKRKPSSDSRHSRSSSSRSGRLKPKEHQSTSSGRHHKEPQSSHHHKEPPVPKPASPTVASSSTSPSKKHSGHSKKLKINTAVQDVDEIVEKMTLPTPLTMPDTPKKLKPPRLAQLSISDSDGELHDSPMHVDAAEEVIEVPVMAQSKAPRLSESSGSSSESEEESEASEYEGSRQQGGGLPAPTPAADPADETPSFKLKHYLPAKPRHPSGSRAEPSATPAKIDMNPGVIEAFEKFVGSAGVSERAPAEEEPPVQHLVTSTDKSSAGVALDLHGLKAVKDSFNITVSIDLSKFGLQIPRSGQIEEVMDCYSNFLPSGLKIPKKRRRSGQSTPSQERLSPSKRSRRSPSQREDSRSSRSSSINRRSSSTSTQKDEYNRRRSAKKPSRQLLSRDWDNPEQNEDQPLAEKKSVKTPFSYDDLLKAARNRVGKQRGSSPHELASPVDPPPPDPVAPSITPRPDPALPEHRPMLSQAPPVVPAPAIVEAVETVPQPIATVAPVIHESATGMDSRSSVHANVSLRQTLDPIHCQPQPGRHKETPKVTSSASAYKSYKEAKKRADGIMRDYANKLPRILAYFRAGLLFLELIHARDREGESYDRRCFMTIEAIKFSRQTEAMCEHDHQARVCPTCIRKIRVLMCMVQAVLNLRLFKLRKSEIAQLRSTLITEHVFTPTNKSLAFLNATGATSDSTDAGALKGDLHPATSGGHGGAGGSSTHSSIATTTVITPTPSPAESNASDNSTASTDSRPKKVSSTTVCMPTQVQKVVENYLLNTDYLMEHQNAMELVSSWMEGTDDFFCMLDQEMGRFNPLKPLDHLVAYVRTGLNRLHTGCPPVYHT